MAFTGNYMFNNMGHLGQDSVDETQRNVSNTRFATWTLSNYFSESISDSHVHFATQMPTVMFSGSSNGPGLTGGLVDIDSTLLYQSESERPLEKLSLMERPFLTVPYLGRGSCDPTLESQLLQGELVHDKKSVSTIMEKSFSNYSLYPLDSKAQEYVNNPANTVQEAALDGWVRGGVTTRDMSMDDKFKKNNRPSGAY
jgi:hypothetical protein